MLAIITECFSLGMGFPAVDLRLARIVNADARRDSLSPCMVNDGKCRARGHFPDNANHAIRTAGMN
jgi:hypothetical protein